MIAQKHLWTRCVLVLLLFSSLLLVACGSNAIDAVAEIETQSIDSLDELGDIVAGEPEFEGETFEEAELPEDFPSSFPIPGDARIGSNVGMGGNDEFRVFLSLTITLDEALDYYYSELPARGWAMVAEETTDRGTEMTITGDEYGRELLFVAA